MPALMSRYKAAFGALASKQASLTFPQVMPDDREFV
jgi:hypothetical protein